MWESERADAESIGAILLVVVVVLTVGSVSGVLIAAHADADDDPTVDLAAGATADDVTVVHRGGDALALSDLTVVVRGGGAERRFTPEAANVSVGDGDGRFEPGERWRRSHGLSVAVGDRVRVLVVHGPTNAVVADVERSAERANPA